jgi:hypothetical protein
VRARPDIALRQFIDGIFVDLGGGPLDACSGIMVHEIASPTPALELAIEHIIRPRVKYLSTLISRYTGFAPSSPETRLTVISIVSQVVHFGHSRPVIQMMWPNWIMGRSERKRLVDHVTAFSLAAMKKMRRDAQSRKRKIRR